MKKVFTFIKRLVIGILLVLYFSVAILVSTLLLNKNDYGVTQFNDKVLILIDSENESKNFPAGTLVVVKETKIDNLKVGDEVFVYAKNDDDTIKIISSEISEINTEAEDYKYIVLKNDGTSWGEKFIAGTPDSTYDNLGKYLIFIESKWMFFILLIVPCFFILLYEIYLIIITVKYGDEEEEEEVISKQIKPTTMEEYNPNLVDLKVPEMEETKEVPLPDIPVESYTEPEYEKEMERRVNTPLKNLNMNIELPKEEPEEIELPKEEEQLSTVRPTKTYLQAPTFNYDIPKKETPISEPVELPGSEPVYSRYDRTLDNKAQTNNESVEDAEARINALLAEVNKLKEELNKK